MASQKTFTIFTKFAVKNGFTGPVLTMAKGADRLAATLNTAKQVGKQMGKDIMALGKTALWAGAGIAAVEAATWKLVNATQQSADDIQNTANALGLTTDALQEYRYVGIQAGLTTEDMDGALTKLSKNIANGGPPIAQALYQIGVSVDDLKNTSPDKTLELIANGFKNVKDPTVKSAVAMTLFGKASVRMVNALSQGADGVTQFRQKAKDIGYVMGGDVLENAGNLNDKLDELGATVVGVRDRLSARAIPGFQKFATVLQAGLEPGGKYEGLINRLGDGMENMGKFALDTLDFFDNLAPAVDNAVTALQPLVKGLGSVVDALATMSGGKKKDIFWTQGAAGGLVDSAMKGDFSGLNGMSSSDLQDLLQQTMDVQAGKKGAYGNQTGILEQMAMGGINSLQSAIQSRLNPYGYSPVGANGVPVSSTPRSGMGAVGASRLDVAFGALPEGLRASYKMSGNAPGITLNTAPTVRSR